MKTKKTTKIKFGPNSISVMAGIAMKARKAELLANGQEVPDSLVRQMLREEQDKLNRQNYDEDWIKELRSRKKKSEYEKRIPNALDRFYAVMLKKQLRKEAEAAAKLKPTE